MNTQAGSQEKLTLHLEGLPEDGGDVRLNIFADKLSALKTALHATDKFLHGFAEESVDFLVADLTHNSPAAISITAQTHGLHPTFPQEIFEYFSGLMGKLSQKTGVTTLVPNLRLLTSIKALVSGYGKKYSGMWFSGNAETLAIVNAETLTNIEQQLIKRHHSIGSVRGVIQRYNSEAKEKSFHLTTPLGQSIKCKFDESQREQASSAVEKNVIIHGFLTYWDGDYFPCEVNVRRIEIIEPDDSLQTLTGLIGSAKAITEGQLSNEFIKNIRNGWH